MKFGGKVRCVFMLAGNMFAFRYRLFNAPKIAQTGASSFFPYLLQDFTHHVFAGFRCGFALSDGYVFQYFQVMIAFLASERDYCDSI